MANVDENITLALAYKANSNSYAEALTKFRNWYVNLQVIALAYQPYYGDETLIHEVWAQLFNV